MCSTRLSTFTAEKSKPETFAKSSSRQSGRDGSVQRLPQTVGQRRGAAEEDVAAQPVGMHAVALLRQDRALGHRTSLAAVPLARGETRFDRAHAAETDGEEHEGGEHSHSNAFQQSEGDDRGEDQHDDAELVDRQPPAASHQSLVEHAGSREDQHSSHERRRHELQHAVAEEQGGSDDERRNDPGQTRIGAEQLAAERCGNDHGSDRAAAKPGHHGGQSSGLEFPVPVQFLVGGRLESGEIQNHADERDQHQRQHIGNLRPQRGPVHPHGVGDAQGRPQTAVGGAGQQEVRLARLRPGDAEDGQCEVESAHDDRDADRQDQGVAPPFHGEVQDNAVDGAGTPSPQRRGVRQLRNRAPVRLHAHQGHGGQTNGSPDSGDEPGRDRIGNEPQQVGKPVSADGQAGDAGGDGAEDECSRDGDEQGIAFGIHRRAERGHADDERGRQPGDRAPIPRRHGDDQAGREVPEQHKAHALRRVRSQCARKYERCEGDL